VYCFQSCSLPEFHAHQAIGKSLQRFDTGSTQVLPSHPDLTEKAHWLRDGRERGDVQGELQPAGSSIVNP